MKKLLELTGLYYKQNNKKYSYFLVFNKTGFNIMVDDNERGYMNCPMYCEDKNFFAIAKDIIKAYYISCADSLIKAGVIK